MQSLYSIAIYIYGILLRMLSFFIPKARLIVDGRKHTFSDIAEQKAKYPDCEWLWIHASSLGEFEQVRHIIDRLKSDYTNYRIALSFYSPSGYIPRKKYHNADAVFYLPLDTTHNAKKLISLLYPKLVMFVKYDFWWNLLESLQIYNIPTIFISSTFRTNQYFIKWRLGKIRKILKGIDHFYVQTAENKQVLSNIGINKSTTSGDSRLDSIVNEVKQELPIYDEIERWKTYNPCIIYGSIHLSDLSVVNSLQNIDAYHLIVPHDIDKSNIKKLIESIPDSKLYSIDGFDQGKVVILDQLGVLRNIYQFADLIYIGGGFGSGIHNILEPLVHLKPILIGPNYDKFPEAVSLVKNKAIATINNGEEALNLARIDLNENNILKAERQSQYIESRTGATDIILRSLSDNHWI